MNLPSLTLGKTGVVAIGVVVSLLAGVGVGAITDGGDDAPGLGEAAEQPLAVLEPIGAGESPPSGDYLAGLMPPGGAGQADAAQALIDGDPDAFGDVDFEAAGAVNADVVEPRAGYSTAGDDRILIDPCASDDSPDDCDGVGGTVLLAITTPFAFNRDPRLWPQASPACVRAGEVGDDQFVFQFETTNLGTFTARYRPAGSGEEFAEVTGETPASWRDGLDAGRVFQAVTCVVADRLETPTTSFEVEVTGVGIDEPGTDFFAGVLDLPPRVADPPPGEPDPTRRAGRPPVTVEPLNAATLRVHVPLGRREQAEVTLVSQEAGEPSGDCVDPGRSRVIRGAPAVPSARVIDEIVIDDWVERSFDVTAPEPGPYLVCVAWLDNFDPPRTLERASLPVVFADRPTVEVLLAGYEQASGATNQPDDISLSVLEDANPCFRGAPASLRAPGFGGAPDRGASPRVLCEMRDVPVHAHIEVTTTFDGEILRQASALLGVPQECDAPPSCTTWFMKTLQAPNRSLVGSLMIGIRLNDSGGGADGVAVGEEVPQRTGDETAGPRLDPTRTSLVADPADPARRAIVTWATDVSATVSITAAPTSREPGCPDEVIPFTSAPSPGGSAVLTDLCPGVTYAVGLHFRDGTAQTSYKLLAPSVFSFGYDVEQVFQDLFVDMARITAELDYTLTFRETLNGAANDRDGVIPKRMSLVFPSSPGGDPPPHRVEQSQYYDGRARPAMECSSFSSFDRRESGIAWVAHGGELVLQDSHFSFGQYRPTRIGLTDTGDAYTRRCPSPFNQFNHTGSDPICGAYVARLAPVGASNLVDRMLAGAPAVFSATVPWCDNPENLLEVTLTVTMREVRTLRGT
jgi:hypothetical protein